MPKNRTKDNLILNLIKGLFFGAIFLGTSAVLDNYIDQFKNPHTIRWIGFGSEAAQIIGFSIISLAVVSFLGENIARKAIGHRRAERLLVPILRKFVQGTIIVCGILFFFASLLSINLQTLLASLGIGGLVVALAAKDSIENIFGSLTIVLDMPFAIGDWVKIDKIEGTVEEINLRSTRIRTAEDTLINLPNANLIRAAVENFGARRTRRQLLSMHLSYSTPAERVSQFCEEFRKYLESIAEVDQEKAFVSVNALGEASISIFVQCLFNVETQTEELNLRQQIVLRMLEIGQSIKVDFVNPNTMTLVGAQEIQQFPAPAPHT